MNQQNSINRQRILENALEEINDTTKQFLFQEPLSQKPIFHQTAKESPVMRRFEDYSVSRWDETSNSVDSCSKTTDIFAYRFLDINSLIEKVIENGHKFLDEIWICCSKSCFLLLDLGKTPIFNKIL